MRHATLSHLLPIVGHTKNGRPVYAIAGGADDDGAEELLARLGVDATEPLEDAELDRLEETLEAAFDAADDETDPDIDLMDQIAGQIRQVREERGSRDAARSERVARAAELRAEVNPADEPVVEEPVEEPAVKDDADEPVAADAVELVVDETDADAPVAVEEPVAVAASASRPTLRRAAARRTAASRPQARPATSHPMVVRAAGDVPGFSAGQEIRTLEDIGRAFAGKASALAGTRGVGGKVPIAQFALSYPEARTLVANAGVSQERISAVVASITQDAIVASGGVCAPVDIDYSFQNVSDNRRPIRDALVRFGADRGGIKFTAPATLSDIGTDTDGTYTADDATAVALWTETTDTTPGSNVKPCQTILCGTEVEEFVDAVTKCLKVGNFNKRTFPEQFAHFWALAGAAHARTAENILWDSIVTDSTAVTGGQVLGAFRDVIATAERAAVMMRNRHRAAVDAPIRFMAPEFLVNMMSIDLLRQIPGDSSWDKGRAFFEDQLRMRAINVTWSPDAGGQDFTATQGAGPLVGWPTTVETLMFFEGSHLFLDGGTLDFGMDIRDSTLNSTNDVQSFTETFEATAFRGVESLEITMDICADGTTSGTVDIAPCVSGS